MATASRVPARLTLINSLDNLRAAKTAAEKKIVERMLRTAAAINVATAGRGVYNSKAKPKAPAKEEGVQYSAKSSPFKPVSLKTEM